MKRLLLITMLAFTLLGITGCKAQKQMQQQITDMETKIADHERRIAAMDTDLKRTAIEQSQLKPLVTKLGNVVVDLQKAEEDRQKAAAEAKLKAAAAAATKKARPAPRPALKKHH